MKEVFALLIIFQIKHFLADFPLQNEYMLGKFKEKDWKLPLAAHAGVHLLFTFLIVAGHTFYSLEDVYPDVIVKASIICGLILGSFDFIVHFIVDRIKASPKMLGRFEALTKRDFIEHQQNIKNLKEFEAQTISTIYRTEERFKERKKSNKYFWWSLGFDQAAHHITHYIIILIMVGF